MKIAKEIARAVIDICNGWHDHDEAVERAILSAQAEARIAAYEDAARLMCAYCYQGKAPDCGKDGKEAHMIPGNKRVEIRDCHSRPIYGAIRALRAQVKT